MRPIVEFRIIILMISFIGSIAIAALPIFTIWTVLPIFAFAMMLHYGHGLLHMSSMRQELGTQPERKGAEKWIKEATWASGGITVLLLLITLIAKVVLS
ncbi:hypothetical protein V0M98_33775 (plasmid) [Pseudomonas silesiensis]|uniref:hypothetical protein n=1 Tax=Pseudomonas silesiensis TaxID=1853130 RepID=UPI0030CBB545